MPAASQQIRFYTNPDGVRTAHATSGTGPPPLHARPDRAFLKLARTVADPADAEHIVAFHLAEAIQYRRNMQFRQ